MTGWLQRSGGLLALVVLFSIGATGVVRAQQPVSVVELFTSQGCSSCPPADRILGEYAKRPDVLALSYHVDYWNYLGWADTFSKARFTERQQRYAVSFQRRGVYTPQAVINGQDHAVGSRRDDMDNMMAAHRELGASPAIPLVATRSDNDVRVQAQATGGAKEATLWIVYFDKEKTVKILRGENRGKTITYHNVVRDMSMLGMMKQGKLDVTLPLDELKRRGAQACAILLQASTRFGTPGPILGATVIDDLGS